MRNCARNLWFSRCLDNRFCFGQQFALGQTAAADDKLAGKNSAFFHRNRPGRYVAFERSAAMNHDNGFSDDFAGHVAANLDALHVKSSEKLHGRFSLDQDMVRADPAGNFPTRRDRDRPSAVEIAAQSALDQSRAASNVCAAEIASTRDMNLPVRANDSAETGGDFVIAQIDVSTAGRTDRRTRRGANFLPRTAFKTLDDRTSARFEKAIEFSEDRRVLLDDRFFLRF